MLKILGAAAILLASAGFLTEWRKAYTYRIKELKFMRELYEKTAYMMETERTQIADFLARYASDNIAPSKMMWYLTDSLKKHEFKTGEDAWKNALVQTRGWWHIKAEEEEFIRESSEGFFGRCIEENIGKLRMYEARAKQFMDSAQEDYREKNKVITPVGMLMGIMLIIILV